MRYIISLLINDALNSTRQRLSKPFYLILNNLVKSYFIMLLIKCIRISTSIEHRVHTHKYIHYAIINRNNHTIIDIMFAF